MFDRTKNIIASKKEILTVASLALLFALPFVNKPYHIDEVYFASIARHILADPWHPESFKTYVEGRIIDRFSVSPHPALVSYILAPAIWFAGPSEWPVRLAGVPFDIIAAIFLFLIAKEFLSAPLFPTLIAMAGPAYFINVQNLMAEKWMAALGFPCIYAMVRSKETGREKRWFLAMLVLMAAALVVKFSSVFLVPTAMGFFFLERRRTRFPWVWLAAATAPVLAYMTWGWLYDPSKMITVLLLIKTGLPADGPQAVDKLRSLLAFTGGCCLAPVLWPLMIRDKVRSRLIGAALASSAALFLPALDGHRDISGVDRCLGILFAAGAVTGIGGLYCAWRGRTKGWELWAPWFLSVFVSQALLYWSIVSRFILFAMPPLVFALASQLEKKVSPNRLRRLYLVSLAATLAISLPLAVVDFEYASAQKEMAERIAAPLTAQGKAVWFTGQWGFQYYMEKAGARGLLIDRGAWDGVAPGDTVIVPKNNSSIMRPIRPIHADLRRIDFESIIPLRLIGTGRLQGGFYSSFLGFLPYAIATSPVDSFDVLHRLD